MTRSSDSVLHRLRKYVYNLVISPDIETSLEHVVRITIATMILLNVVVVMLETMDDVRSSYHWLFGLFEVIAVVVFSLEYLLRVWAVVEDPAYAHPVWGRLRYVVSFMALVDLIAIIPFYLPEIVPGLDVRIVQGLRLVRLLRVLKLGLYAQSVGVLSRVMVKKKSDLITAFLVLFLILIFSSSLMYFLEHEQQPKAFSSIPASMWWGIATLTTIGYGDIYPVTALGKFCAAVISLLGIGLVALPSGIMVTGFVEEMQTKKQAAQHHVCPHCGEEISGEGGHG